MAQSSEVSALLHPHEVISQFFNPIAHDDSVSSLPNSAPARLETPIESVPDIHNLLPHFPNLLDGSNPASPINGPQKLSARSLTPLPNDSLDLQNAEPLESKPEPVPSSVQLVTGSLQLSETESTRIADMIVEILERYRMTPRDGSSPWVARHQFVEKIVQCIEHQSEIRLALPAFPFKSPNKTAKVLGDLPDCGEETALLHLNGMCQAIGDLHKAGASLHIVSDGLMYNDILGVSDLEVWNYGQCLRKLAERLDCRCIRFIRLVELLGRDVLVEPLSEEEYLRDAPTFREKIYETFLPQDFDVDAFIGGEKDATLTYRGYLKFLELDLENALVMTGDMSKSQKKKGQEEIAKKMIRRGKAFANAIKVRLSSYIRLSIHSSTEATKLSISVIPQYDKCAMTPWHSSLVRALDGSVAMCHALKVPAKTHDLIMEGGCPWYFRERSELFNWSTDVQFKYLYPCGILIRPRDLHAKVSFHNIHMQKVRTLAEKCSPIVLRGFMDTTDRHTYIVKAYDAGKPRMSEIKAEKVEQKEERQCMVDEVNFGHPKEVVQSEHVKQHPRFRYITSLSEPQGNNPDAFFASSRLFWQNLPSKHSQEKLSKLEWSFESSSNSNVDATEVFPLAIPHPTDPERRCIRWPNNWHQLGKNSTQPRVKIQNGSQYYASVINSVLSDRRVCLFFAWEKGDVVLSDNIATLHGGRGFDEGSSEDFWQIDLD